MLIHTGDNLGFAGGNNVGLRYLHARGDHHLVWILNNDIDVAPDSLRKLVDGLRADPSLGAVAATLYEYREPEKIQSAGGGVVQAWHGGPRPVAVATSRLDYLSGGCMLASLSVTRAAGLMAEEYFLYAEDVDYSLRIRAAGHGLGYVPDARVWHKGGASVSHASPRHDYYIMRNYLYLMRKYYPASMPVVLVAMAYRFVLPKIVRRQWTRLGSLWRAVGDFRSGTMGPLPTSTPTTQKS